MIHIEHTSFTYENAVNGASVSDIHTQIPKGQVVLLCGESGSGKTTFSRLINGLIPYYYEGDLEGDIYVGGKDIRQTELFELASFIGSVFQNPKSQFYTLQTDTEIVFACENLGMPRVDILDRFDRTVEGLRIENLLGKSLFALSGGEKQKIACASVSALMPDLFVLDEPSSNLDIGTIKDLQNILLTWKTCGRTIVIAEHRLAWLQNIADRVLYFKDGKIIEDLPAKDFWRHQAEELHQMGLRAAGPFHPACTLKPDDNKQLELRNFRFSYKKSEFLNIPVLKIPCKAVVAVLGDNGAGKTTFARCVCGLEKKAEGVFIYDGQEYTNKQRTKLCYMVMQDVNHQLFAESVLDEVLLGTGILQEEDKNSVANKILSELALTDYKEAHPMSLSGGQRQRVAIAGALASHKEIIVFDEPTSGLDYRHMQEVANSIRQLSVMGKTQFIITHDPELVAACCDYFIYIENGMIKYSGKWTAENKRSISDYFDAV